MEEKKITIYKLTLIKNISEWEFEKIEVYCHKLQWFTNDEGKAFVICHYWGDKQHTYMLDQFNTYQYEELTI